MSVRSAAPGGHLPAAPRLGPRARLQVSRATLLIAAALTAVILGLGATTENFLTTGNLRAVLASASIVGIAALGATVIMIAGGMVNMATAALASVSGMVFLGQLDAGLAVAVVAALAVGAACSWGLGWLVGAWAVNPIIATIAAASLLEACTLAINDGDLVTAAGSGFERLNERFLGLPVSVFVFLALGVALHALMVGTPLGRRIHLVGENREAARVAGLRLGAVVGAAFALGGALIAVAGMFMAAVNTNASLGTSGTLTFDAVAAVLVGGTAITGGRGSAVRTVLGALAVATISDILLLRGLESGAQTCVKGLLVLLVVVGVHLHSERRTA